MLVDLHAHYPMHVAPADPPATALRFWSRRGRASLLDHLDAAVIHTAGRLLNHESLTSGPRVTIDGMRRGGVGVALSVLCTPMPEMGNHLTRTYSRKPPYGAPPKDRFFAGLMRQLEAVEAEVGRQGESVRIARNPAELDAALAADTLALVHCVEGSFSLGGSPESIGRAVRELAARGVAYVTIAHLYWRHTATNVPAVPLFSDAMYERIFPQPEVGLGELGRAAIRALVSAGVIVDLTHMSAAALADTFALLDELDPDRAAPVIASHCGYRFGRREYNLTADTVTRIAERDGVVGLILSSVFIADGLAAEPPTSGEQSFEILCRHIDQIAAITGSHRHIAIGSDLDGFIKPVLPGFEDSGRLGSLGPALAARYGPSVAEEIRSGNALRVLRAGWRGGG
jgi:microsomal dipeptidase-like Zn-dependent dipeptidase